MKFKMLLVELRITLPLTVEEYQVAQLYAVAQTSLNETGGGEGVTVLKNEPFTNYPLLGGKYTQGQYTYKIYHLDTKIPYVLRAIIPKGVCELHEESWNAYPYCTTFVTNPGFMKDSFRITVRTMHLADRGLTENVHNLTHDELAKREVIFIDIANDSVSSDDSKTTADPSQFLSTKTGRGKLTGDWRLTVKPVMTCYKLFLIDFRWRGISKRMERLIARQQRRLNLTFHRNLFCWIDEWHGMSMSDIRKLEDRTLSQLERSIKNDPPRGTSAHDSRLSESTTSSTQSSQKR